MHPALLSHSMPQAGLLYTSNDIASVVQSAVNDNDVLYVPTDNTAASNTEVINNIAGEAGVPIIAGEAGICKGCGVATLSLSLIHIWILQNRPDTAVCGQDWKKMCRGGWLYRHAEPSTDRFLRVPGKKEKPAEML